jgi:hypothetical protein
MSPSGEEVSGPTVEAAALPGTVEAVIRQRLVTALGGWRGSVETALPMMVFVALWVWQRDVKVAVLAAVATAVVLAVVRLVQRSSLAHVLGAVFATGIAAAFALNSGRAEDAFLPGILTSAGYLAVSVISILSRWPVLGFVVAVGSPDFADDPLAWRRDRGVVRVCARLSWVLVGVFAIRVAIMVPLYLAGQVAWLGVAKVVLGWPLWAAALALMGWLLVSGHTPLESEGRAMAPDAGRPEENPPGHRPPD